MSNSIGALGIGIGTAIKLAKQLGWSLEQFQEYVRVIWAYLDRIKNESEGQE